MTHLELGPRLKLPLPDAVAQKCAFIGRTGSGKTHAALRMAEQLLMFGAQIIAIDWVGIWYGLRLAANGKAPWKTKQPLYILGGQHGDVPLEVNAGERYARLLVERNVSAVIDVSLMRKSQRQTFVTAFAEELFHAKKSRRSPMHLFLEEAQAFLPQMVQRGSERMLGAFEDIGKVGRNYGIGLSLITQRPQAVHKDVLNQTELLLAFQLSGPQERKAVEAWATEVAGGDDYDEQVDENLLDTLPTLKRGECVVWSPQWLRVRERFVIGPRQTFDVRPDTYKGGKAVEPKPLTPDELAAVTKEIADVVEKASADDPRRLRQQLVEMERMLTAATKTVANDTVPMMKLREQNKELRAKLKDRHARLVADCDRVLDRLQELRKGLDGRIESLLAATYGLRVPPEPIPAAHGGRVVDARENLSRLPRQTTSGAPQRTPEAQKRHPTKADSGLSKMEAAILDVLARFPDGADVGRIALLARYRKSGGFYNTLSALRTKGLMDGPNTGTMRLTEAGLTAIGGWKPPLRGRDLQDRWLQDPALGKMERAMLSAFLQKPLGLTVDDLAAMTGYAKSGGFYNSLSALRTAGVIVGRNTEVMRPSDDLCE